MMRYGAEDFNYTFVSTEEGAIVGEGASTDIEDPLRRSSLAGDVPSIPFDREFRYVIFAIYKFIN